MKIEEIAQLLVDGYWTQLILEILYRNKNLLTNNEISETISNMGINPPKSGERPDKTISTELLRYSLSYSNKESPKLSTDSPF